MLQANVGVSCGKLSLVLGTGDLSNVEEPPPPLFRLVSRCTCVYLRPRCRSRSLDSPSSPPAWVSDKARSWGVGGCVALKKKQNRPRLNLKDVGRQVKPTTRQEPRDRCHNSSLKVSHVQSAKHSSYFHVCLLPGSFFSFFRHT